MLAAKRGAVVGRAPRPAGRALARWQQFRNTSSGTMRIARTSAAPRKVLSPDRTTPAPGPGAPWPAMCTTRHGRSNSALIMVWASSWSTSARSLPAAMPLAASRCATATASRRAPGSRRVAAGRTCGSPITSTPSSAPASATWARNACGAQLAQQLAAHGPGPSASRRLRRRDWCRAVPRESPRCRRRARSPSRSRRPGRARSPPAPAARTACGRSARSVLASLDALATSSRSSLPCACCAVTSVRARRVSSV